MSRTSLLSLPTEIRLQIYGYLLHVPHIFLTIYGDRPDVDYPFHAIHADILHVNHSIASETYTVLYGDNIFHFLSDVTVRPYFLARTCMELLRHVSIGPMQTGAYKSCAEMSRSVRHLGEVCPRLKTLGLQFWLSQYTNKELVLSLHEIVEAVGDLCGGKDVEKATIGFNQGVSEMEMSVIDLIGLEIGKPKKDLVIRWMKHALAVMGRVGQIGGYVNGYASGMLQRVDSRVLVDRRLQEEWGKRLPPPTRWLTGCYAR